MVNFHRNFLRLGWPDGGSFQQQMAWKRRSSSDTERLSSHVWKRLSFIDLEAERAVLSSLSRKFGTWSWHIPLSQTGLSLILKWSLCFLHYFLPSDSTPEWASKLKTAREWRAMGSFCISRTVVIAWRQSRQWILQDLSCGLNSDSHVSNYVLKSRYHKELTRGEARLAPLLL